MDADSKIFSIGNAAGEAHPILGEGISMGLQSAAILCQRLLDPQLAGQVPTRVVQAKIQRRYVAEWRREFGPRMRLAALFAHIAMRPHSAAALVSLVRVWPGLLTRAAVWGGKVHAVNIPRPSQEISPWQPLSNT
jgi:flavin-dependent dehydrogenase